MNFEISNVKKVAGIGRAFPKHKALKLLSEFMTLSNIIVLSISFLMGRANLLGGLMPFGITFYASTIGSRMSRILIGVSVILGAISFGNIQNIYITIAAMLIFNALSIPLKKSNKIEGYKSAIVGSISVLIPQIVVVALQGWLMYDLIRALLNTAIVFTLVLIFKMAVPIIEENKYKKTFSNEEMISLSILIAISIAGLGELQFLSLNLRSIFSIFIILVFGYKCGAGVGTATGVTVGLIVSMSSQITSPLILSSYAFCGLLTGVLKNLGKIGSGLGFVLGNALLTYYLNGSTEIIIHIKEIIGAVIIFMILPASIMDNVVEGFRKGSDQIMDKRAYSGRIKDITVDKLNKFSKAFQELSRTFGEISETKVVTEKNDISVLFDRIADNVCKNCSLCKHCWDLNFYNTYQVMFKIVETLDTKGRIENTDIPKNFQRKCEKIDKFVIEVNNVYEIFKVDIVWRKKIGESRGIISQQLNGISTIISNLAKDIDGDYNFNSNKEEKILRDLRNAGIKIEEVIVFENMNGKYEINILHNGCKGLRECITKIEKVISNSVGRKMIKEENDCTCNPKNNFCQIKFIEEEKYKITTGISKVSKSNSKVSGDSYTFMNTGKGKYIIALSDGMGSGQKASKQSSVTINLIEQFMDSGFDKDTTLKLINALLVLKSNDDSFTTIDLSVVDLYKGEVEFVKVGAVPTFIKREDRVENIKTVSLPAGVLSNIEMELVHKKINTGDFIIMMSDGVLDYFSNDTQNEKEMTRFINEVNTTNPQEMADRILDEAYKRCENDPTDDMLVIVSKVWKKTA